MAFNKLDYQTDYSGITNSDIASFLKRTLTTSEKTLVNELITEVERSLCTATSRQFRTGVDYEESFGSGISQFELFNVPISSITAIIVDGVDVTSNYTLGTDFWVLDELYVKFKTPITSTDLYTGVKIDYQIRKFWGEDIELLIKKWVSYEFLNSENAGIGVSNFSFSDLQKAFDTSKYLKDKERLISYYTLMHI